MAPWVPLAMPLCQSSKVLLNFEPNERYLIHSPSSLHSTLLSIFIKYKALLTSDDFHIVFPLHTANNKHKSIFYETDCTSFAEILQLITNIVLNAIHFIHMQESMLCSKPEIKHMHGRTANMLIWRQ